MANPRRPGNVRAGSKALRPPTPPPEEPPPLIDPDELRQIQMLAEAVLVSFSATPNPAPPYGRSKLGWVITMPTTVLPGVAVEVHLFDGIGDALVQPQGNRTVAPYGEWEYSIYLKAPKARRHLGTVSITIDLGSCTLVEIAPGVVISLAKGDAERAFPPGGKVTLRGGGASVDIGINSFVVDIPLTASVPNWFDADIDVTMGFSLWSENGELRASHNFAKTDVSPGALSNILSLGCAKAVAAALEAQSDGILEGFIGPEIARRLRNNVQANIDENLLRLNQSGPARPYKFYDISLTQNGATYRYCPIHPRSPRRPPFADEELHPF
jgi:hypothetical protein